MCLCVVHITLHAIFMGGNIYGGKSLVLQTTLTVKTIPVIKQYNLFEFSMSGSQKQTKNV